MPEQGFDLPMVSAAAAVDVAAVLNRSGIDAIALFEQAGIDPASTEDPYRHVRLDLYTHLLQLAAERAHYPTLGLELVRDRETKVPAKEETDKLVKRCFEKGLVLLSCGSHGNVIRTLMPLVITDEQLERGLSILEEGFRELTT